MDHFSILSVTALHRYLSNMLGHTYENISGQPVLHRRRILGACLLILGVILFGARFELASFAGCWTKPGCSNDQWEAVYRGSWVLFFLGWASFFIRIFLFVIGIILATYFPHKAPASEDAHRNAGELSHLGAAPVCPNQSSSRLRPE